MKINKSIKLMWICALVLFCILGFSLHSGLNTANAQELNEKSVYELFADEQIADTGYLYNYDDSEDYVYVKFANDGGYAIFAKETMEIMEYSLDGGFPYNDCLNQKKYYGGPNSYFLKNQDSLINIITNETISFTDINSLNAAQTIRDSFCLKQKEVSNDVIKENISNMFSGLNRQTNATINKVPPIDENNLISPTSGAKYIENSAYFLTKGAAPFHGANNGRSCTSVAIQLMLSYNNYYNDRRIIAPEHLYGGWNAAENNDIFNYNNYLYPDDNPNVCESPNDISSKILGSTQAYHDYLYNNGVVYFLYDAAKSLKPLLNSRNINYDIIENHTSGEPIGSSAIINELNKGYPTVLAMSSSLNGTANDQRKIDHSVLAYGYQELKPYANDANSYLGYIVHFGWDSNAKGDNINVWTNSAWYYNYLTLHINHSHEYTKTETEHKCKTCGRRVDDGEFLKTEVSSIDKNGVSVVGFKSSPLEIMEIPSTINGKTVTQIGNAAFANQTVITEVTIAPTIKSIGANAFQNCTSLAHLHIDSEGQLAEIGNSAFEECTTLSAVNFPASLKTIGANVFANCKSLLGISFATDSQLTTIGNAAFYSSGILMPITIPASVSSIGANAFQICGIPKVEFEKGSKLTTLANSVFAESAIFKIELPNSITSIGYDAFSGCTAMDTIILSDNVTNIGGNAFAGCSNLTIYTSKQNPPSGWIGTWNSSNRPAVFGCQISNGRVMSFTKSATNPYNINAENGVKNPEYDGYDFNGWYTTADFSGTAYNDIQAAPNGTLYAKWVEKSCVAQGTLITLADGRQVAVEDLTGDEQLLVWNLHTGKFDVAPILFIDRELRAEYEIIKLKFSDGTVVKVIDEHGFWDVNLNKYVYLDRGASKYIGHSFNKQTVDGNGNMAWTTVELVDVEICREITSAWSPVTYGHLCYYVNGMLSMPGGIGGLFNIFDVDGDTMQYDKAAFEEDIAKYGLFTYEEFAEQIPLSQEMFEACGGQYLKVAIGKGLITVDELTILVERYGVFFG